MSVPVAAAPPTDTAAPKMDRSLDDALVLEPGATCLERETLLAQIRDYGTQTVDDRIAIRVNGSNDDPRSLRFAVLLGDVAVIERTFDAAPPDCAALHSNVALTIAIALDDELPAKIEQALAGEGDLPDFSDDEPIDEPAPRRRPTVALMAAGAAFVGVTPRASFGGLFSLDIRPLDHFDVRIGALATHLSGFRLDAPGYDDGRVAVTVAAGRLDLCWGTAPRRVRARVCGGLAGGATISAGRGYTTDFRRTTPWFAGLAGLDLSAQLIGPLAIELRVEGVFPLQRTILDVRSTGGQLLARERFPVAGLIIAVGPRIEF